MSRATEISAKVFGNRVNEAVYDIIGHPGMGDGGSTASTKNIEDHLRAKGFTSGNEYRWISQFRLQVKDSSIDRDLMDSIQSAGAQVSDEPEYEFDVQR
jgi:hypothetical protein